MQGCKIAVEGFHKNRFCETLPAVRPGKYEMPQINILTFAAKPAKIFLRGYKNDGY